MLTSRQTLASETVKILPVKTSKGQHTAKNHLNTLNYSLGREPHTRGNLYTAGKQDNVLLTSEGNDNFTQFIQK